MYLCPYHFFKCSVVSLKFRNCLILFFCLVVMMESSVIDLVEDLNGHQENDGLNVFYRGIFVSGLSL